VGQTLTLKKPSRLIAGRFFDNRLIHPELVEWVGEALILSAIIKPPPKRRWFLFIRVRDIIKLPIIKKNIWKIYCQNG
jgi:hypothetical protein